MRERKRERERGGKRERKEKGGRKTEGKKEKERKREREMKKESERERERHTQQEREKERETEREKERERQRAPRSLHCWGASACLIPNPELRYDPKITWPFPLHFVLRKLPTFRTFSQASPVAKSKEE